MEQFRNNDKTPFNSPLLHANFETNLSNIKTLRNNESHIIRTVSVEKLLEFDDASTKILNKSEKLAYIHEKLQTTKKLISEFATQCSVIVPRYNYVIGERAPKAKLLGPTLYTEVERIHGVCVGTAIENGSTEVPKDKVDELLANLLAYNTQKLFDEELFLSDISRLDQFMYGTSVSCSETSIFLADLDPLFERFELGPDEQYIDGFYIHLINQLYDYILKAEAVYKQPLTFARSVLSDCLASIGQAYPSKRAGIEDWRTYLKY